MNIIFYIAAVLAILTIEINAAATGAVGNVKEARAANNKCPNFEAVGVANDGDEIDGTNGCMKMICVVTNGWTLDGSTHCLCCAAWNDVHFMAVGDPVGNQGTISYDCDINERCSFALFFRHVGNVPPTKLIPKGPSPCSVFSFFGPCNWDGQYGDYLSCMQHVTFTRGPPGAKRYQIRFVLRDGPQDINIKTIIGDGAPVDKISGTIAGNFYKVQSTDLTNKALNFPFKSKSCVRCIWRHGMLAVCPNLLLIFYRPDSDPLTGGLNLFGLCGMWTDLNANGKPTFENPNSGVNLGQPTTHEIFVDIVHLYLADNQPNCKAIHSPTLKDRSYSQRYIAASEETCQGYSKHVDVCTKSVTKYGGKLPEETIQTSIRACVTDLCGVTRSTRNADDLQKGLNKWARVAAEVAEARSIIFE